MNSNHNIERRLMLRFTLIVQQQKQRSHNKYIRTFAIVVSRTGWLGTFTPKYCRWIQGVDRGLKVWGRMDSLGLSISGVSAKDVMATAEAQRLQKTSHTVMAGSSIAGVPEEISGGAYGLPPPEAGYINSVDMEILLFAEQTARERREREEAEALAKYRLATSSIVLKSQKQQQQQQYVKAIGVGTSTLQGSNSVSDAAQVKEASSLLPKIVRKRKLKPEEDSKTTLSIDNIGTANAKRRLSSADEENSGSSSPQPPHDDENEEEEEEPGMLKGLVAYSSGSEDEEEIDDGNPRGTSGAT